MTEQSIVEIYSENLKKMPNLTEKQRKVLQAALELFADQGYEATSSQQIAEKAGVSAGAVYHTFPNKQAILIAVLSPIFQGTMDTMAEQFMTNTFSKGFDTLEEFIRAIVKDRLAFVTENRQVMKLLMGQLLTNPEMVIQIKNFFGNQAQYMIVPVIEKLKHEKKICDLSTDYIIQVIFGVAISYFGKLILEIDNMSLNEEIEMATKVIVKLLEP